MRSAWLPSYKSVNDTSENSKDHLPMWITIAYAFSQKGWWVDRQVAFPRCGHFEHCCLDNTATVALESSVGGMLQTGNISE